MSSNPSGKGLVTDTQKKPSVYTYTASRTMKFYQISQRELNQIGALNRVAAACYAVSTLFIGLIGGCIWDKVQAKTALSTGEWSYLAACLLFAIVSVGLGCVFTRNKKAELKDILSETDEE